MAPSRSCRKSPLPCRCAPCRCAHPRAAVRRVAAMSLLYRRACRDTPQQPSLHLSRYNRLYRDTLPSRQAFLSCHDTMLCIATLTLARPCVRAVSRPARRPALSWPSDGRIVGCIVAQPVVSWKTMRAQASLPSLVSRYKLLYSDPVQTENGQ